MRLIEKVWFDDHKAKFWLVPLLYPLTIIFWLISALRRIAYQLKILPSYKLPVPVIVVGNISVGGNGKTPMVLWLIKLCSSLGLTPGVISRGYGGKAEHYPYLLTQSSTVEEAGDEPLMIFHRTNAHVCVGADRIKSAKKLIDLGCQVLITDDGLQHYRLQRDIEFLVIDGKRRFGNGQLLPAGPLREGGWRIKKVDYVINNGQKPRINETPMSLMVTELVNCKTGESSRVQDVIANFPRVNAIAGIGAPDRFYTTVKHLGFRLENTQSFIDHHAYTASDLAHFSADVPLLMTEKDAIKCYGFAQDNWWYVKVDAHLPKVEENLLVKRIERLVTESQQN